MKTKEAIERVKARFDKWALDEEDLAALQALGLVPMESKDERIRKALIHLINEQDGFLTAINGISVKDIIAYLERQKDKRELDFSEGKVEGVKQTCQEIKDAMSLFEPKGLTPFELTFRDYIDSAIRYCLSLNSRAVL